MTLRPTPLLGAQLRRLAGNESGAPNRTHFALVEFERAGLINGVITQMLTARTRPRAHALVPLHGDINSQSGMRQYRRPQGI